VLPGAGRAKQNWSGRRLLRDLGEGSLTGSPRPRTSTAQRDRAGRGRSRLARCLMTLTTTSASETAFLAKRGKPDAGAAQHRPWCRAPG
jgi:hypothetical protein